MYHVSEPNMESNLGTIEQISHGCWFLNVLSIIHVGYFGKNCKVVHQMLQCKILWDSFNIKNIKSVELKNTIIWSLASIPRRITENAPLAVYPGTFFS